MSPALLSLCSASSAWIYENLTKILRAEYVNINNPAGEIRGDSAGNLGGNTCFGLTMRLYRELVKLGYEPKLLLGHKKYIKNVHCAITIIDNNCKLFLDPGYLIFDPLPIPPIKNSAELTAIFPLQPNWVKLEREGENLNLYTGTAGENAKFRFYFPLKDVSQNEFCDAWEASYYGESMKHLVFNKLDKKTATQYYYQNGKLLIRTPRGARQEIIAPERRLDVLSGIYGISADLLDCGLLYA